MSKPSATEMPDSVPVTSILECPVCFETFNDPRILACGHTFCRCCLETILDKNRISCPKCRQVQNTIPSDLPVNYLVKEIQAMSVSQNIPSAVKTKNNKDFKKVQSEDVDDSIVYSAFNDAVAEVLRVQVQNGRKTNDETESRIAKIYEGIRDITISSHSRNGHKDRHIVTAIFVGVMRYGFDEGIENCAECILSSVHSNEHDHSIWTCIIGDDFSASCRADDFHVRLAGLLAKRVTVFRAVDAEFDKVPKKRDVERFSSNLLKQTPDIKFSELKEKLEEHFPQYWCCASVFKGHLLKIYNQPRGKENQLLLFREDSPARKFLFWTWTNCGCKH